MKHRKGLSAAADSIGITIPLALQVNLLGELLGHALREVVGEATFERVERLRTLCKSVYQQNDPRKWEKARSEIRGLPLEEILWLIRAFTTFFHLVNKAEQREIVRINRERERGATPEKPRSESIAAAIYKLKQANYSLDETLALLAHLDIQPTLTAHPTEARRRAILRKQTQIALLLARLQGNNLTPVESEAIIESIYEKICLLLTTDEFPAERVSVLDEVRHGLHFLTTTIWEAVPRINRDLRNALQTYYQSEPDIPAILRYRSWIGGDRDGNPFVTPEVTRTTLDLLRSNAIRLYLRELRRLRNDLTVSSRLLKVPEPLRRSLDEDRKEITLPESVRRMYVSEPFRLKLSYMIARLQGLLASRAHAPGRIAGAPCTPEKFIDDLVLLKHSLRLARLADSRRLNDLCVRLQTFGFHLASLDIRQHSGIHEQAVAELLNLAGVTDNYAGMDEASKLAVLHQELQTRRPLVSARDQVSPGTASVLQTLRVIHRAIRRDPHAIGSYVVSMTHQVSDLLEVLLLAKEAALWQYRDGTVTSALDLVPLFETIDDLQRISELLAAAFTDPVYRAHLRARNDFQEIMLGYSDSNKDGGYGMANWSLYEAQQSVAEVCAEHHIDFRLFHGRGGTVGRGGGRAYRAILAMPPVSNNGRIRFTEQGEVITFRYSSPNLAHRHLEQIVHAMLIARENPRSAKPKPRVPAAKDRKLMSELARQSMLAYQRLIRDPDFWPWYIAITPIEHISRLPIASRPVSRKAAHEVDFDGLRAIPWVFAWTQTRYNVPGWFGMGAGLSASLSRDEGTLEHLQRLYREWPFFRVVLDNMQLEMKRAHLPIARFYAQLYEDGFHDWIAADFDQAYAALSAITGNREILDNEPVLKKSITLRNPYTDVLNFLQAELLQRWRQADARKRDAMRHALFLSINGIAAAMQSTG